MNKNISYTIDLDANLGSLESKLNGVKGLIDKLTASGGHPELLKMFKSIENSIDKIRDKTSQPIDFAGLNGIDKEAKAISIAFGKLLNTLDNIRDSSDGEFLDLLPPETVKNINAAINAINNFNKAQQEATAGTEELIKAREQQNKTEKRLEEQIKNKNKAEIGAESVKQKVDATRTLLDQSKQRLEVLESEKKEAEARIKEINDIYASMQTQGQKTDKRKKVKLSDGTETTIGAETKKLNKATENISTEKQTGKDLSKDLTSQESTLRSFENSALKAEGNIAGLTKELEECKKVVNELALALEKSSTEKLSAAYQTLRQEANSLGISMEDIPVEATSESIETLTSRLIELRDKGLTQTKEAFDGPISGAREFTEDLREVGEQTSLTRDEIQAMNEQMAQEQAFANKIKQFIGAAGAAKFFSNALRGAFKAVQELDKVMTDMAVVTDLNVGDYWDQMPEYTERANALGVSIKSAYESTTLFFQQGLKTNEAVALSNETLKMARIAGLDAADATDRMTAALRGFNMELNEASAQKVADVYAQLAAITASDVDEISTAMTKTASIASNAGMEFETTAAFLSQIIETTRESAETAGTAMKTVIARFQELKKDPSEIGEVDGEIVDANKIETALRTVGVSLRDASGQFRDLDDVFLELASKWDSLDTNTQRYIATIAAGSRQQSRFIAMMSDYGRTQELVGEAQNSAGASNEQYEKTLDSLESKLARLENAWTEFTTGVMNSDLVKGAVDFLTSLLNTLNKVTKGFGSVTGTITKIGTALAIFKTAKIIIDKFGKSILNSMQRAGQALGIGFQESVGVVKTGMKEIKNQANGAKVSTPTQSGGSQSSNTSDATPSKTDSPKTVPGYGEVNLGVGEKKHKASMQMEDELLAARLKYIDAEKKQAAELEARAANMSITGRQAAADNLYKEAAKHKENAQKVEQSTQPYIEKATEKQQTSDTMDSGQAQEVGKTIGDTIVSKLTGPFAERNAVKQETKAINAEQQGLRAATEFGNGQGLGADRQFAKVEEKIDKADVGDDLKGAMGFAGNTISASAMGFGIQGNDYETQFFESGSFEQGMYGKFEAAQANGADADTAAKQALGISTEGEVSPEDQARIDQFKTMVEQWNQIISNSVNQFQTANQTIDAINNQMAQNAADAAAAANGGAGTPEGKKAADEAKKKAPKLLVRDEKGESKPGKTKEDKKKQKKAKPKKDDIKKEAEKENKKVIASEEELSKKRDENAEKVQENIKKQQESYSKLTSTIGNVGTTLSMVGVGVGVLGGLFESMGLDGVAEGFNTLGTVMSVAGAAVSMVSTVMGILTPIMNIATIATSLNTGATIAETGAKAGSITATIAQTIANWAMQASMSPILLITLLITAAILVLIATILILVNIFNAVKNSTPEAKLEQAKASAEAAGAAADRAAESYNNLKESLQGLDDQYSALEEMTKGTREWNDAVNEINNSVLDLIDQYPELASVVETDADGVMRLDMESEEVQDIMDKYQNKAQTAKAAELAAKMNVVEKQRDVDFKNLSHDAKYDQIDGRSIGAGIAAGLGGLLTGSLGFSAWAGTKAGQSVAEANGRGTTEAVARALAKGGIVMENGEMQVKDEGILKELGLSTDALAQYRGATEDTINELTKFGQSLEEGDARMDAMFQQMASSALAGVDMEQYSEEQQKQIQNMADDDWAEGFYNAELEAVENVDMGKGSEEGDALKQAVALNYGEDAEVDGNTITYTDENGDEKEIELTDEEFKEQYAAMQANDKMAAVAENIPKAIAHSAEMFKDAGDAYAKIYEDKEGKTLTKEDLSKLESLKLDEVTGDLDKDYMNGSEVAKAWKKLSKAEQDAYGSYENYVKNMKDATNTAEEAFKKVAEYEKKIGVDIDDKLTSAAAKGFAENLDLVLRSSGEAAAQSLNALAKDITTGMTESDLNKFYSSLNAMDWTDADAWKDFPQQLKEMGVSIPEDQLDRFIEEAKDAANALKKVDLNKFTEELKALGTIIKDLLSGEQTRKFDEDEYKALIEMDPKLMKDFSMNLDGTYTYLGKSLDNLADVIFDNTEATLNSARVQLESKVSASSALEKMNTLVSTGQKYSTIDLDNLKHNTGDISLDAYLGSNYAKVFAELSMDQYKELATGQYSQYFMSDDYWLASDDETKYNAITKMAKGNSFANSNPAFVELAANEMYSTFIEKMNSDTSYRESILEDQGYMKQESMAYDINERKSWEAAEKESYLQVAQEYLKNTGIDIGNLGIEGFSEETNIAELSEDQMDKILDGLAKIEHDQELYQQQLKTTLRQAMALQYKAENRKDNINDLSNVRGEIIINGKLNEDNLTEMEARMEAFFSNISENEYIDEESLSMYADLMNSIFSVSAEDIVTAGGEIDSMYQEWLDAAGELETKMDKVVELYEQATEESEKVKINYNYMAMLAESIAAAEFKQEQRDRNFERQQEYGTISAEDVKENVLSRINSNKSKASDLKAENEAIGNTITNSLKDPENAFAKYFAFDTATGEMVINQSAADAEIEDPVLREKFNEYVEEMTGMRDEYRDNQDTIQDMADDVAEMSQTGKEEYLSMLNTVKEGLINQAQAEVDALSTVNDSIQTAGDKLANKIQEQIDEQRQQRQNEKTEQGINDKLERLAALRRDTSGANGSEIAALEKEIADEQQSYQDTLIDQQIKQLQDDNAKAAEQRQQQIDIAQAQLDLQSTNGEFTARAEEILTNGLTSDDWRNTLLASILKEQAGYDDMSDLEKENWENMTQNEVAMAGYWQMAQEDSTGEIANAFSGATQSITDALDAGFGNENEGVIGGLATSGQTMEDIKGGLFTGDGEKTMFSDYGSTWGALLGAQQDLKESQDRIANNSDIQTISVQKENMMEDFVSRKDFMSRNEEGAAGAVSRGGYSAGEAGYKSYLSDYSQQKKKETLDKTKDTVLAEANKGGWVDEDEGEEGTSANSWFANTGYRSKEEYEAAYKAANPGEAQEEAKDDFSADPYQGVDGWFPVHFDGWDAKAFRSGGKMSADFDMHLDEAGGDDEDYYVELKKNVVYKKNDPEYEKLMQLMRDTYNPEDAGEYTIANNHAQGIMKDGQYYVYWDGVFRELIGPNDKPLDDHSGNKSEEAKESNGISASTIQNYRSKNAGKVKKRWKSFATGGLADFTGPAWLDGTKSRPEYILNAEQTDKFFNLIDVLDRFDHSENGKTSGDNYFDININVDSIANDYDVDQMAERIKQIIYDDSMYRNVNAINSSR